MEEVPTGRRPEKFPADKPADGDNAEAEAAPPGITVSLFDYSVENHCRAIDTISELCNEPAFELEENDIKRLSSSITFVREWRHFCYKPRIVKFACKSETPLQKDVFGGTELPQFSSAAVPKKEGPNGNNIVQEMSKDCIMYVGGSVWALDWCPRANQTTGCDIRSEFLAVAAHPPDSSYHRIGAPLTGRGVIQIWCVLNVGGEEKIVPAHVKKKPKQNPKSADAVNFGNTQPKKPRGRPRKKPIDEAVDNVNGNNPALAVQLPEDPPLLLLKDGMSVDTLEKVAKEVELSEPKKSRGRPRKKPQNGSLDNLDGNDEYQYVQALSVQLPEESTKSLSIDGICQGTSEQVGNLNGIKGGVSGELKVYRRRTKTINGKLSQLHKSEGRPRNEIANESAEDLDGKSNSTEAFSVEVPEDSSKLLTLGGVSLDFCEKDVDENMGRYESGPPCTTNAESREAHEPRGRPRKKQSNGIVAKIDNNNLYVEALAGQSPAESSSPSSVHVVFLDTAVKGGEKDTSRKCNLTIEGGSEGPQQNPGVNAGIFVKCKGQNLKGPNKKLMDESAYISVVKLPEDVAKILPTAELSTGTREDITKSDLTRKRKGPVQEDLALTDSEPRRKKGNAEKKSHADGTPLRLLPNDSAGLSENNANAGSFGIDPARHPFPVDVTLPRVVLCLAHNGKVAWDVKWRPHDSYVKSKYTMGYLAVLLGNGALEVWDVPFPRAANIIYSAFRKEGTDPRFVKLNPVFRCSSLKYGDRQSIPLTLEWSASSPHDLILAGCHDGVVALWKFSSSDPCKETRPLLCFSADTSPIRALAWAPTGSDAESSNIIVTAGHKGIKFWDLRIRAGLECRTMHYWIATASDPFRPLWDLNPVQRVIYSLDWLPDPRCIIISFDDGTLRILTLSKAANDVPVTGKTFTGTQQQGLHSYYCSPFALWSVQVSRLTGMVAYCGADGTVLRFQLTLRAVEKDPLRNRAPHFLCGSLTEEESVLTIVSPLFDVPFPMKKSLTEWANAPRTIKGFMSVSNQEKRAKEMASKIKKPDTLAICYEDDPGSEFGPDEALMTSKSKQKPKPKSSSKKKALETDQALICRDSDKEDTPKEEEIVSENEIDKFPPKIVAMHKVRWNMNKGSERWLCYGGASGVLRCQEINLSSA